MTIQELIDYLKEKKISTFALKYWREEFLKNTKQEKECGEYFERAHYRECAARYEAQITGFIWGLNATGVISDEQCSAALDNSSAYSNNSEVDDAT